MKLLCEISETTAEILIEENENSKNKNYFIEGVFLQSNIQNKNGRIYPKEILANEVGRYKKEKIEKKNSYGELNHPGSPVINLDRASHLITDIREDGDNFIGKAKILSTPMGNIVKSLINDGCTIGVSSRGLASIKKNSKGILEVQPDFKLATAADIVSDPSAPDAFVQAVNEGRDWIFDAASQSWILAEHIEKTKASIKSLSLNELEHKKLILFEEFCKKIANI